MTSHKLSDDAKTRLQTMTQTNDGFEIAEVDLRLRGPGDIMGTQQSGLLNLKIADVVKDNTILQNARHHAIRLLKKDANMEKPEHAMLKQRFIELTKDKFKWNYIS
jgi:ATP-dependent DNA helicase RecG